MKFSVVDTTTGKQADLRTIALDEGWTHPLIYCDMEGFALLEDGTLIMLDECGNYVYCPEGRFQVTIEEGFVPNCAQNGAGEGNRTPDQQLGKG